MVTFIVLVITGFSLRFSESWWVRMLFGWEGGFPVRGIVHRVAAVLFIITSIWHTIYLFTPRGKQFLKDMLPSVRDFHQFWMLMRYNLSISSVPPRFGRFSYVEKAEYWALIWGTIVMVLTGASLWFKPLGLPYIGMDILDVFHVVHYYEACLAFLAILVGPMHGVVFNPHI